MLAKTYPLYLGGEAATPNFDLEVFDKYTGELATRVPLADPATIERGIALAQEGAPPVGAPARARALRAPFRGAPRGAREGALHRGGQADQRLARRGHAPDRHL